MAITIKVLVEALADLFGMDETEVLSILLGQGIGSYSEFLRYLNKVQREDRLWLD